MTPSNDEQIPHVAPQGEGKSRSQAWLAMGVALFLATIAIGLWRIRVQYGDSTPRMTNQAFEDARRAWRKAAVEDYDLEVVVQNRVEEIYRVRVRGGLAREATRNGAPLTQSRTFETWSVPGMFGTIASDWRHVEERAAGKAPPGAPNLSLRVEFDPQWGFPKRYRRIEYGSAREISWQVTRFEPASAESAP